MMPTPILSAYSRMLPVLTAEESLLATTRVAVGSGTLKKGTASSIQRAWQRTARPTAAMTIRPSSAAAYGAQMARMGLGVRGASEQAARPVPTRRRR